MQSTILKIQTTRKIKSIKRKPERMRKGKEKWKIGRVKVITIITTKSEQKEQKKEENNKMSNFSFLFA